jgi:hypothetical protein
MNGREGEEGRERKKCNGEREGKREGEREKGEKADYPGSERSGGELTM